jgi:hypothetical protein
MFIGNTLIIPQSFFLLFPAHSVTIEEAFFFFQALKKFNDLMTKR